MQTGAPVHQNRGSRIFAAPSRSGTSDDHDCDRADGHRQLRRPVHRLVRGRTSAHAPSTGARAFRRFHDAARPFDLIREHDALARDLIAAALRDDPRGAALYLRTLRAFLELRGDVAAEGWPLPPLPDELADLDIYDELQPRHTPDHREEN
jgi:hypothetical protein